MLDEDSRISALPLTSPTLHRDPPSTQRGARTRAALIASAREVFETAGYLDARLIDIAKGAGCATGSFYTYFANKEEVFAAVLEVAREEMMHPGMGRVAGTDDPYAALEASNRAYLAAYQRNAKLMGLMEQVAHIDPEFRRIRNERADAFIRRNARGIADLQKRGIADASLDPLTASIALSGMVSRFAFSIFTLGEGMVDGRPLDFEDVVVTVTKLWANALRFPDRG
ncbi:TetR family transcriptional regulator [Rhodococcus sp. SRB_17]|uniref:TetR/AcrR family transcriptional regulator n=1 Tax=Rhodococcus sp. OK302 TaxID=1882769 RepID=UPI000B93D653|nr:TetR/AcrR family transcriptional regulator [Rhodococcus sp. OK302]NMM85501.1 TetR family transcriptional regulator [Rhodococcus sp. SRB_17]OYD67142.1 TetR family transcriptional regulator [Rhodococcus sp. OK302]